jgi:pimeloyl-ACP methyl ester carboxylesterase
VLSSSFGDAPTHEERFELSVAGGTLVGHRSGKGPPALVLHGGPGLPDYMQGCAAELEGVFSTFRYTQRGTPPSTVRGPFSIEAHVADALAVLDAFNLERVWAVGHSWGGHLALHLAVAHPDRLDGIVCLNPLGASNEVFPDFHENLTRRLTEAQRARFEDIDARDDAGSATEAERLEALELVWPFYFARPEAAPASPIERMGEAAETFRSIADHFERGTLAEGLPNVRLPALFLHGRDDPLPLRASVDTAALLPDVRVEAIPRCGHFPWIEVPGEVRTRVASRVRTVSPSQPASL